MKKCACLVRKAPQIFFLSTVLCFLLFTNINCKKDKLRVDQLPAATQIGKGTFGCLVNGEAFTPTIELFSYSNHFSYGYDPDYGFGVDVINKKDNYFGHIIIELKIKNIMAGQTYVLDNYNVSGKGGATYTNILDNGISLDYTTNNQVNGTITITKLDPVKEIISGVFAFKAISSTNGETINVTDGRFDLTFK